jgi:hypothetical protein
VYTTGAVASGPELAIFTGVINRPIAVTDTITVNLSAASTVKSLVLWEFTGNNDVTYVTGGSTPAPATASPSITTTSIPAGDVVVGFVGSEGGNLFVEDSDTTNGTWATRGATSNATGASGNAITSQWKLATAAGTQTYNPTLSSTTPDNVIGWVQLHLPATTSTKNIFFWYP